jgi:LPS export ABC transporter protein LptC
MKRYVKHICSIGAGIYVATVMAVLAQEPIEDLRLPLGWYPDGTLKTELFAKQATVRPDATIAVRGMVFRVFSTNGTVETTITAEDAQFNREKQVGRSEKAVSMQQGGLQVTGEGFRWNGVDGTLQILRQARVSLPAEMIKTERILKDDAKKR